MTTENNQIDKLNIQAAFVGALIFAASLNLYIITMYKDLLINKSFSKYSTTQIYKLAKLTASIFLIVTIYFFIEAYDAYENDSSQANYNYYLASVLSFVAQSIRLNTVLKYPETILGSQDII